MPFGLHFAFRGRTLCLTTNDQRVCLFAKQAFQPLLCAAPHFSDHQAEVRVAGESTETLFDGTALSNDHYKNIPDIIIAAFYATRDIFARFAAADPSCWACYGAAVRLPPGAVLLLGPTTVGKTILALHLLAQGADFYSDESFVIDRTRGWIEGLSRRVMVREPALPLLPNDTMRAACLASEHVIAYAAGRLWYALDPATLIQRGVSAAPAPVAAIVLIDEQRVHESRLVAIHSKQACMELARRLYQPIEQFDDLAELCVALNDPPSFRLSLGQPSHAAALISKAVEDARDSGR